MRHTEISKEADVHLQTLVRHFPTKAEIMAPIHTLTAETFERYFLEREGNELKSSRVCVSFHQRSIRRSGA